MWLKKKGVLLFLILILTFSLLTGCIEEPEEEETQEQVGMASNGKFTLNDATPLTLENTTFIFPQPLEFNNVVASNEKLKLDNTTFDITQIKYPSTLAINTLTSATNFTVTFDSTYNQSFYFTFFINDQNITRQFTGEPITIHLDAEDDDKKGLSDYILEPFGTIMPIMLIVPAILMIVYIFSSRVLFRRRYWDY